jgi:signal transduction histidine kinase
VETPNETTDLLTFRAMPRVADALRRSLPRIVDRWTVAVERYLPDADPLTVKQVRNSIPAVLDKIALALESNHPEATAVLREVGTAHGVVRFQEAYNIEDFLLEYRLLRRITFDEVHAALGRDMSFEESVALDMGIDTALQRGVASFVEYLSTQLRSANETESKYLSFLSHDLRNNLNGVTLTLEWLGERLAEMPELREEAHDLIALRQSVSETVEGMDRLLQAERLRREAVQLKKAPTDLVALLRDIAGQFSRKAADKGLRIEVTVPPGAAAFSDRELVTLVLQNLLGNAIKYSAAGVVRLSAETDMLGWKLAVSDQGPGIARDKLATLFNAFTRGETHGQSGMGLGLTIASHAARILGSELQVESELGNGATFSFTVPPADADKAV